MNTAGDPRFSTARARLEVATANRAELRRLTDRLATAEAAVQAAAEEAARLDAAAASERADVRRLEQFSPTRIWAGMRGRLSDTMSREQAEVEAAAYAAARGRAHLNQVQSEARSLAASRDAVAGADAEFEAALAELAAATEADPAAAAEARTAGEDARHRLQAIHYRRQAEEALAAGTVALDLLREAGNELGNAESLSAWDTWAGGDFVSSIVKHNRLDTAAEKLTAASEALGVLGRELHDVNLQLPGVSAPIVDAFTRGVDIWFDNIFTDLMVRDQIKTAAAQVDAAIESVELTMTALQNVRASLADA